MLYECLTAHRPFPGDSLEQQISAHLTKPPPRPSAMHAGIPAVLDTVIASGMAKDPDQRYATTKDLAQAARAALIPPASSRFANTESTGAEGLPSHEVLESSVDSAAVIRTQAGPTMSASDAPTQQAPVADSKADAPARFERDLSHQTGVRAVQRFNPPGKYVVAGLIVFVITVALIRYIVWPLSHVSPNGSTPSSSTTMPSASPAPIQTINPEGAARSVVDVVSRQTGFKPTDVTCPVGVEAKVGQQFECHFTGPEPEPYTAHMTITTVQGDNVEFYVRSYPGS